MMEAIPPRSWKEEFEWAASARREELVHKDRLARNEFAERQRKSQDRDIAEEKQDRQEMAEIETTIATQQQVAAFKVELDDYDTKTVEAMMDNQKVIDALRVERDKLLAEAEVLPDGRRVFKTRDGQRVSDEHGQEVSANVIDPASIDDRKPRSEAFNEVDGPWAQAMRDQEEMAAFQAKLDDVRERVNKGEISEAELKEIKADLKADMPDAVRQKLEQAKPEASAGRKPNNPVTASAPQWTP